MKIKIKSFTIIASLKTPGIVEPERGVWVSLPLSFFMREKTLEKKIKALIKAKGGWCVKFFANAYTQRGIPDLLACINGYFLAIEVKSDRGRVSPLQEYQLKNIRKAGGRAFVISPQNFEELKKVLEFLKNS